MDRKNINIEDFNTNIFTVMDKGWMLLNAGDSLTGECNPMTISWGLMGTLWFKPVVMVGVRPQRHTLELLDKYDTFTLNALPEDKREIMSFCGSKSGRDVNKVKECGLTVIPSAQADCPGFDEAELIIECRKLYTEQLKGKNFIDKSIVAKAYEQRDFHQMFVAEVLAISGTDKFTG